ncbi:redoxin domain-containing protein [Hymenobacter sp. HMF4947]|uniref:Thioredoxin peroxidase n=1 Tax=Hymenobacter ginkgonis TaxID=2682976 RepID=A0A7K1TAS0_9BACT|nr:peroxiredoxin [Hymenobacter ginkgonis]MVN75506.1 redoxin domain-containing protein [Hymenobacter ginkgonis]
MAVLVGKRAPAFKASAVIGTQVEAEFSLDRYLGKRYVLFFFYPADFSGLCPTELLAFQELLPEFERRGVAVVGCSTDSHQTHAAWLRTPLDEGGIGGVTYPLVADASKTISANYDVLAGHYDYSETGEMVFVGTPQAYRGLFLIDRDGIVRHQLVNDRPLGRRISDSLRMVDALQHFEEHGETCPANWEADK